MPLCTSKASNDLRIMSKVLDGSLVNCLNMLSSKIENHNCVHGCGEEFDNANSFK